MSIELGASKAVNTADKPFPVVLELVLSWMLPENSDLRKLRGLYSCHDYPSLSRDKLGKGQALSGSGHSHLLDMKTTSEAKCSAPIPALTFGSDTRPWCLWISTREGEAQAPLGERKSTYGRKGRCLQPAGRAALERPFREGGGGGTRRAPELGTREGPPSLCRPLTSNASQEYGEITS